MACGCRLAKIDASEEKNRAIGKKYGVRGYPTLKIFKSGTPVDYSGPRDAAGIVNYIKEMRAVRYGSVCPEVDLSVC